MAQGVITNTSQGRDTGPTAEAARQRLVSAQGWQMPQPSRGKNRFIRKLMAVSFNVEATAAPMKGLHQHLDVE